MATDHGERRLYHGGDASPAEISDSLNRQGDRTGTRPDAIGRLDLTGCGGPPRGRRRHLTSRRPRPRGRTWRTWRGRAATSAVAQPAGCSAAANTSTFLIHCRGRVARGFRRCLDGSGGGVACGRRGGPRTGMDGFDGWRDRHGFPTLVLNAGRDLHLSERPSDPDEVARQIIARRTNPDQMCQSDCGILARYFRWTGFRGPGATSRRTPAP